MSDVRDNGGSRLGGARADFVASLGRKVNDARELLAALEDDPSSRPARDELRRRLHALGAGSRLLRFDAMARSLQEALAVLDRGALMGVLGEQDVLFVAQVVDDLPALAWGESPPHEAPPAPSDPPDEGPGLAPIAVLVVGPEGLAEALTEDGATRARAFECERTEDAQKALELARAYSPDIVIVDAELPQSDELVEALLDDPLTEPVPIIVVGAFPTTDEAARFVALGVAKALPKPVAPEVLRAMCDELLDAREGRTLRVTLGEPTLEQLADRLADELKRALVDSVDRPARACRVPLGEGTEVLGALWGAIARVQEIVTQRTGGAVRFGGDAPEGAIAVAPWLHQDVPGSERLGTRGRAAATDVRLHGRVVVVADDDPGVTWFISDLLRTAGCEVHEALDGQTALEIAFRVSPELVVSDILMPGLDGFALCRALRRDVALRDVPVILLSWKEDLLQRVRELGASAAAYMRKESDSRSILARVREVLRPRARIEMRLRGEGEVRGRLDGLTPRLLLELVGAVRKDARIAVRDATCLYEIEIRGGAPRKATRTASDGSYVSGERAVAALLGVGAGRFVVTPSVEPIRGELAGSLFELLAKPIAAARGAAAAVTGARAMQVERIALDPAGLEEYLGATPDPARTLVNHLARGASPRQMLLAGEVSPSLLEDVLVDLAARGAIRTVQGPEGEDFLAPAVELAQVQLGDGPRSRRSLPPNARPSVLPSAPSIPRTRPRTPLPAPTARPEYESLRSSTRPPPAPSSEMEHEGAPSSLEDAVMREISDRSPNPGGARVRSSNPPPIVEPSQLRKRSSSNPPAEAEEPAQLFEERSAWPSIPPDAVVPGSSGEDSTSAPLPAATPVPAAAVDPLDLLREPAPVSPPRSPPPSPPSPPSPPAIVAAMPVAPVVPTGLASPPPPEPEPAEEPEADPAEPPSYRSPFDVGTQPLPLPAVASAPALPALAPAPRAERTLPLSLATRPAPPVIIMSDPAPPPGTTGRRWPWVFVAAFAALGISIGAYLHLTGNDAPADPQPVRIVPVSARPSPPASVPPVHTAAPSASAVDPGDLPPGAEVPPGFGLLEVTAPAGARVRIDGAVAGAGPVVDLVAAPGYHDVRVEQDAGDDRQVIEVRAGKTTRVRPAMKP